MKYIFTLASFLLAAQCTLGQGNIHGSQAQFEGLWLPETELPTAVVAAAEGCRLDTLYLNNPAYNGRRIHHYDAEGNLIETIDEDLDGGSWVQSERKLYAYNGQGYVSEEISEEWTGSWSPLTKTVHSYDGQGNRTESISQEWDGIAWVNSSRSEYLYDGQGNETENIYSTWDGTDWVDGTKTLYVYDGQGNTIETTYQYWNGSEWQNSSRFTGAFDAFGNMVEEVFYYWDVVSDSWVLNQQFTFTLTYDTQNRVIESVEESFDGVTTQTVSKTINTYNAYGDLLTITYYSWDGANWVEGFIYTYIYDCSQVGIEETDDPFGVTIWPNPVSVEMRLNVDVRPESMMVIDATGKAMMNKPYQNRYSTDKLLPGIYILELRNEHSLQRLKFVKH